MSHFTIPLVALLAASTLIPAMTSAENTLKYPKAPSDASVSDIYFGHEVRDPYRPLENDTAAATLQWVEQENLLTRGYLDAIPFRQAIKEKLTALTDYPKVGRPTRGNDGMYYLYRNNGLQNQSVLYRKASLDAAEEELFLDPNTLSDDGTVALTAVSMSPDGKLTAYTISRSGSDWTEIYLMDTKTRRLLPDHIEWAKFTDIAWHGNGFFYSAYDKPEDGKEFSNSNENHRIYYHQIGTPQSQDRLVYTDPEHPLHFHSAYVPKGSHYLVMMTAGAGNGNGLQILDLDNPDTGWVMMEPSQEQEIAVIDIDDDGTMVISSYYDAPNGRVMVADVSNPARSQWRELIPEQKGVLGSIKPAGPDHFLVSYETDASQRLYLYDRKGQLVREVKLPGIGTVSFSSAKDHKEVSYTFTSFLTPADSYSYDIDTDTSTPLVRVEVPGYNPDEYTTEQVFYTSKDGTKVPMFLTYKKGLKRDGSNPVYLYGYGGFNISLTPSFSSYRQVWFDNGGIYAQTNLRGGSEYGEEWHRQGTKMNKQNVFDDFISAAEYLVSEGYTSPEHIAIEGGSNGGLLVGAVTNMRPDLFKVAVPRVGVMDMMRYHLFTIGWNWAPDYGTSADSKEMAEYLLGYSPIHNIKDDGTPYPAILVTTADHDDRVVPAHSFKYAATLQASDTGDAPKLIRIESKAGHGAGKPISKVIDEYADIYSFIFYNLGRNPLSK